MEENIQTTDQTVDAGDKQATEQQPKTYTQEEVNGYIAKEAKKAQEKFLRDLGVDSFENAKEGLEQLKAHQESQKTESQKQAEALAKATEELTQANATNKTLVAQLSALKQGVNAESLDDVITLAERLVSEDKTIDDAIADVLVKYPQFKTVVEQVEQQPVPKITVTGNPDGTGQKESDPFQNIINSYKK